MHARQLLTCCVVHTHIFVAKRKPCFRHECGSWCRRLEFAPPCVDDYVSMQWQELTFELCYTYKVCSQASFCAWVHFLFTIIGKSSLPHCGCWQVCLCFFFSIPIGQCGCEPCFGLLLELPNGKSCSVTNKCIFTPHCLHWWQGQMRACLWRIDSTCNRVISKGPPTTLLLSLWGDAHVN